MHINLTSQQYLVYLDGYRIRLAEGLLLLTGEEEGGEDESEAPAGVTALITRIQESQAELDKLADEETSDDGDEGGQENTVQQVKRKIEALMIDIKIHCRAGRKTRCGFGY
jgi:hypothetical protein